MKPEDLNSRVSILISLLAGLFLVVTLILALTLYTLYFGEPEISFEPEVQDPHQGLEVVDGIDLESGLMATGDYELVKKNCTPCHSGKLITQNKATREGWASMISWMQETQGLWDLGGNQDAILDYLESCYGPEHVGRRKNLEKIEWYELEP